MRPSGCASWDGARRPRCGSSWSRRAGSWSSTRRPSPRWPPTSRGWRCRTQTARKPGQRGSGWGSRKAGYRRTKTPSRGDGRNKTAEKFRRVSHAGRAKREGAAPAPSGAGERGHVAALRVWGRRAFQAAERAELTMSGKESEASMARSEWVELDALGLVLAALMPANRPVMEVILATGLRISDALSITREQVERGRFTVREQKTGKTRRVYLPRKLQLQILAQAGRVWAFEGRLDWKKHRTRAAVYKDV